MLKTLTVILAGGALLGACQTAPRAQSTPTPLATQALPVIVHATIGGIT